MQAPHESIRFLVPPLSGLTSIAVQLVVGGQPSNTFIIAVDPPVINNVNIYDVTALVCWALGAVCCFCPGLCVHPLRCVEHHRRLLRSPVTAARPSRFGLLCLWMASVLKCSIGTSLKWMDRTLAHSRSMLKFRSFHSSLRKRASCVLMTCVFRSDVCACCRIAGTRAAVFAYCLTACCAVCHQRAEMCRTISQSLCLACGACQWSTIMRKSFGSHLCPASRRCLRLQ